MKAWKRRLALLAGGAFTLFIVAAIILAERTGSFTGLFLTPDQQAQRLLVRRQYKEAAARFNDPIRKGVAYYRGGEYESAVKAFNRVNTYQSHFNRGNALVMLGKYEDAVKAYDRALQLRPDWDPARENREIALLRGERTKDEGGDVTGGKLGADDIVIETGKRKNQSKQSEIVSGGQQMSDKEIQALWLRRVETKPADFLRRKFAFQISHRDSDDKTTEEE